jgi:hypothetical protein
MDFSFYPVAQLSNRATKSPNNGAIIGIAPLKVLIVAQLSNRATKKEGSYGISR